MQSTLSVTGAASVGGNLVVSGTLSSVGAVCFQTTLSVSSTVYVGSLSVAGGVTVVGSGFITGGGWSPISDRRVKKNIVPITNPLTKVKQLRGVYFDWSQPEDEDLKLDGHRHIGFIAQDVQHVVPEAVGPISDGKYLGVDYSSLVPLLLESIRELEFKLQTIEHATELKVLEMQQQLIDEQTKRFKYCDCSNGYGLP